MEKKWLEFIEINNLGKTRVFKIRNVETNEYVGVIKWCCSFRKYAFYTEPNLVFSISCLRQIADFIEQLMNSRNKK